MQECLSIALDRCHNTRCLPWISVTSMLIGRHHCVGRRQQGGVRGELNECTRRRSEYGIGSRKYMLLNRWKQACKGLLQKEALGQLQGILN